MEIQELIFFFLHEDIKTIEVHFRLNVDYEEEMRTDFINLNEASEFGYELLMEDNNILEEEDEDDDLFWLDSPVVDEDNLISFLNEYYIINPDKLPKPEFN